MPRRGLFQLQPSTVYIRRLVEGSRFFHARRTQFAVLPADTRIVCAARAGPILGVHLATVIIWRLNRLGIHSVWFQTTLP